MEKHQAYHMNYDEWISRCCGIITKASKFP